MSCELNFFFTVDQLEVIISLVTWV